ncbi:hypothetical protein PENSUB_10606 [Penicillium subrubescens]|uniref:Uncharacterized protein n=1 Tax=Penicillium subrubescens TaxID=1316194 RepID=A0A1Q5T881_9EURO|nr:hypothetical protein PENSUB_10606 [Penicillium subrubescens]
MLERSKWQDSSIQSKLINYPSPPDVKLEGLLPYLLTVDTRAGTESRKTLAIIDCRMFRQNPQKPYPTDPNVMSGHLNHSKRSTADGGMEKARSGRTQLWA